MYTLKRLNVIKIVSSESKRDDLLLKGFKLANDIDPYPEIDTMTVSELKAYASSKGIDLNGSTKKDDILAKIKEA